MAYSLASGLAIYFLTSNVFGIIQYAILGRANWSNVLPFLKKKDNEKSPDKGKQKVVDVEAEDVPEPVEEKKDEDGQKKHTMPKRKRPKLKKRK
jgi:membrane protein insertase Oxa1/YidC/SpoIIIJ